MQLKEAMLGRHQFRIQVKGCSMYLDDRALHATVQRRRATGRRDAVRLRRERTSRHDTVVSIARCYDILQLVQHTLCVGHTDTQRSPLANTKNDCNGGRGTISFLEDEKKNFGVFGNDRGQPPANPLSRIVKVLVALGWDRWARGVHEVQRAVH